jgi:hypothetical protein
VAILCEFYRETAAVKHKTGGGDFSVGLCRWLSVRLIFTRLEIQVHINECEFPGQRTLILVSVGFHLLRPRLRIGSCFGIVLKHFIYCVIERHHSDNSRAMISASTRMAVLICPATFVSQ